MTLVVGAGTGGWALGHYDPLSLNAASASANPESEPAASSVGQETWQDADYDPADPVDVDGTLTDAERARELVSGACYSLQSALAAEPRNDEAINGTVMDGFAQAAALDQQWVPVQEALMTMLRLSSVHIPTTTDPNYAIQKSAQTTLSGGCDRAQAG